MDKKVWISFDGTTDSAGRYGANFIVGLLENNGYYLGNIGFLEKTNSTTVSRFVLESLSLLSINYDNVLACITDGVAYMTKAVESLQVQLQKMIHINCLANNLNRVAEKVVELYPELNEIISLGEQVFLKAPLRREKLLTKNLSLSPEPVITRWGTWLEATDYYLKNYETFTEFVRELEDDTLAVNRLKELVEEDNNTLQIQLLEVTQKYVQIVQVFKVFETRTCYFRAAKKALDDIGREFDAEVMEKLFMVLDKNVGFNQLCNGTFPGLSLQEKFLVRKSPVVSFEAERFFKPI